MKQHNILQISGDAVGGIRKHIHSILFDLLGRGASVYFVRSGVCDSRGSEETALLREQGCHIYELPIKKKPALGDLFNIVHLVRFCKINKISLIHGHGAKGGLYSRCVGLLCGIPVIYTPHGGSVHKNFGRFGSLLYKVVECTLKPLTKKFLFESKYTKSAYVDLCGSLAPEQYAINYNGADIQIAERAEGEWNDGRHECLELLVVGMLRPEKGHVAALKALALILKSGRSANIHFCGDGADRLALENLARQLKLESNVFFHGDVSNILDYYVRSSIVLVPSFFESFGYVGVEAGLMRRPVIGSAVGGLQEVVVDGVTGLLVEAGDAAALAKAVESLVADPVKTAEMINAAQLRCLNEFSSQRMLSEVFKVYQSALNCH